MSEWAEIDEAIAYRELGLTKQIDEAIEKSIAQYGIDPAMFDNKNSSVNLAKMTIKNNKMLIERIEK